MFEERDISSEFACETLNFCAPYELPDYKHVKRRRQRRLRREKRAEESKTHETNHQMPDISNAIKILQMTDVHVDHDYAEVCIAE